MITSRFRGAILATAIACALALAACGASDERALPLESTDSQQAAVALEEVTVEKWLRAMEQLEGSIVVADMWATWCIPCIERFPHMIELFHRYEQEGVVFVSVCLDDPGDLEAVAAARSFLDEQGATFPNYLITENTADAFEKLDLMTIPAVFVYGPDGRQRFKLTADDPNNQFTDEDVEAAIVALLSERRSSSIEPETSRPETIEAAIRD